jgi:hypothetical protein
MAEPKPITESHGWNPPAPDPNGGVYPFVSTQRTRSGHVFEVNDALGYERILRQHKSGTLEDMRPDGSRIIVVQGSNYTVIHGDNGITVVGDCNITVNGNLNTTVMGNHTHTVHGSYTEKVIGQKKLHCDSDVITEVQGTLGSTVKGMTTDNLNGGYQSVIASKNEQTVLCPSKLSYKAKEELIDGDSSSIQLSGKTVTAHGADVHLAGPNVTITCDNLKITANKEAEIDYGKLDVKTKWILKQQLTWCLMVQKLE